MNFSFFRPPWLVLVSMGALNACSPSSLPNPLYDRSGGFFDRPFPSDERLSDQGFPDWTEFPNPTDQALLSAYVTEANAIDGTSTLGGIFFRFDAPLDTRKLPSAQESMHPTSPVQIIDVDPDSPEKGRRFPLSIHWQAEETAYQPSRL
ncbi:MAG: hypothetical protein VX519_09690, partial [Myxococcota bacterium]|nr:hypothetical protein [Myxococcota bacterium]